MSHLKKNNHRNGVKLPSPRSRSIGLVELSSRDLLAGQQLFAVFGLGLTAGVLPDNHWSDKIR